MITYKVIAIVAEEEQWTVGAPSAAHAINLVIQSLIELGYQEHDIIHIETEEEKTS